MNVLLEALKLLWSDLPFWIGVLRASFFAVSARTVDFTAILLVFGDVFEVSGHLILQIKYRFYVGLRFWAGDVHYWDESDFFGDGLASTFTRILLSCILSLLWLQEARLEYMLELLRQITQLLRLVCLLFFFGVGLGEGKLAVRRAQTVGYRGKFLEGHLLVRIDDGLDACLELLLLCVAYLFDVHMCLLDFPDPLFGLHKFVMSRVAHLLQFLLAESLLLAATLNRRYGFSILGRTMLVVTFEFLLDLVTDVVYRK